MAAFPPGTVWDRFPWGQSEIIAMTNGNTANCLPLRGWSAGSALGISMTGSDCRRVTAKPGKRGDRFSADQRPMSGFLSAGDAAEQGIRTVEFCYSSLMRDRTRLASRTGSVYPQGIVTDPQPAILREQFRTIVRMVFTLIFGRLL